MTKVVLLQNIPDLGQKGDIKDVSDGYARNFLFPKKLAEMATEAAIQKAAEAKKKAIEEQEERIGQARKIAEKLRLSRIVIRRKEKSGKLFGSISPKEIVSELKKMDLEIAEKSIIIGEPIKSTGRHEVTIRLERDIQEKIEISVEPEN